LGELGLNQRLASGYPFGGDVDRPLSNREFTEFHDRRDAINLRTPATTGRAG
jgi:hypothetical protein